MRIKNGVALGCHGRTARTQGVIVQPANYHAAVSGREVWLKQKNGVDGEKKMQL